MIYKIAAFSTLARLGDPPKPSTPLPWLFPQGSLLSLKSELEAILTTLGAG